MSKIFNLRPDEFDERDYLFRDYIKNKETELPDEVDLRPYMPTVFSQNDEGSCTGQGTVANIEYLENKKLNNKPILSRQYFYNKERINDGTNLSDDSGSTIRNAALTAVNNGCAEEIYLTYGKGNMTVIPSIEADQNALKHKVTACHRILSLDEVRQSLAQGLPVLFGATLYESFQNVGNDGKIPMPNKNKEHILGGHCMLCVAYRKIDKSKCGITRFFKSLVSNDNSDYEFVWRNSWGLSEKTDNSWGYAFNNPTDSGFGDHGYGYATEKVMQELVNDMWVLTLD